jgi:cytochrome P450
MTDDLLDVMAERGADGSPVEFMHDFAFQLPVTVICELLGIPEADRAGFRPLARDLAATVEVEVDLPTLRAADAAAVRLHEYLTAVAAERRADATEVGGVPVPGGTEVITLLGAGNRDPSRFTAPGTFDPLRPDVVPLSFGAGAHFCLGAALARLEGAIVFPRLLRRFPRLAAAGEPARRSGLVLRGFETLPVTVA